jgi:hypothetical protein
MTKIVQKSEATGPAAEKPVTLAELCRRIELSQSGNAFDVAEDAFSRARNRDAVWAMRAGHFGAGALS